MNFRFFQISQDANSSAMDILWYFSIPFKVGSSEPNKIATAPLSLIPGFD